MVLCGGVSEAKPATDEIHDVVTKVKEQVASKTNSDLGTFEAVSYASQVVAGTMFYIKVKSSNGKFIHLKVFRPLPPNHEKPELNDLQEDKSEEDPIVYF